MLALILDSRLAILFWGITLIAVIVRLLFLRDGGFGEIVSAVVLFSLFAGIIIVAFRWWVWHNTEYVITNRRLLNASGILNKRSADSSLEKINDAILEVNAVGRLLGYGDLKDPHRGRCGHRPVPDAQRRHRVQEGDDEREARAPVGRDPGRGRLPTDRLGLGRDRSCGRRRGSASCPGRGSDRPLRRGGPLKADTPEEVAAVLAQLSRLREQGSISSGEYEIKKKELLDRL